MTLVLYIVSVNISKCTLPLSCFYSNWNKLDLIMLVTSIIEKLYGSNMSLWPTTVCGFSNHLKESMYDFGVLTSADSRAKIWPVKYIY